MKEFRQDLQGLDIGDFDVNEFVPSEQHMDHEEESRLCVFIGPCGACFGPCGACFGPCGRCFGPCGRCFGPCGRCFGPCGGRCGGPCGGRCG
ncbi:heterocycloanthracin/sonorensin family bacteriocin [Bacillus sp. Marseille-Q3570]|uniref:heterocycloanthracin/sonorensin family bacteriocin n=1 Tax=Bacillus sp. Marseille-Q3570 TaxID=2963522 RepID=UPI0021B7E33E|nr:heterocycloanthracin/sonorensin family bacteriocin [Bacillus sp. Marseille-Q3570]